MAEQVSTKRSAKTRRSARPRLDERSGQDSTKRSGQDSSRKEPLGGGGGIARGTAFVESLYRRAVSIREAALGSHSPRVAPISRCCSRGARPTRPSSRPSTCCAAGSTSAAVYGDDHCETAGSYHLLANLLFYQKRELAAQRLYERALKIERPTSGRAPRRADAAQPRDPRAPRRGCARGGALRRCLAIRESVRWARGLHQDGKRLLALYRTQDRTDEATKHGRRLTEWHGKRRERVERPIGGDDEPWLRAQVPFRAAYVPDSFKLKSRIYGHRGYHLRHIEEMSGAERVYLRLGSEDGSALDAQVSPSASQDGLTLTLSLPRPHGMARVRPSWGQWPTTRPAVLLACHLANHRLVHRCTCNLHRRGQLRHTVILNGPPQPCFTCSLAPRPHSAMRVRCAKPTSHVCTSTSSVTFRAMARRAAVEMSAVVGPIGLVVAAPRNRHRRQRAADAWRLLLSAATKKGSRNANTCPP